jgi:hypothetical protein
MLHAIYARAQVREVLSEILEVKGRPSSDLNAPFRSDEKPDSDAK